MDRAASRLITRILTLERGPQQGNQICWLRKLRSVTLVIGCLACLDLAFRENRILEEPLSGVVLTPAEWSDRCIT